MKRSFFSVFGSTLQTGNQALVIDEHNFSAEQKQLFAYEHNLPVCVFIDNSLVTDFQIDFYYPHRQSSLCLHGSLAAAKYFFSCYPELDQGLIITKLGQQIQIQQNNGSISLVVKPQIIAPKVFEYVEITELLKLNPDKIKYVNLASVGSPKLLVEINSMADLFELNPNLAAIVEWGKLRDINGIYVYFNNYSEITGRNFNHLDPLLEDSATGVAAGALCTYLQRDLEVHQGQNINNHCIIQARYSPEQILIGGQVYSAS